MGSFGVIRSYGATQTNGRRSCYVSIAVGSVVLVLQGVLWWILYKVPLWAEGFWI